MKIPVATLIQRSKQLERELDLQLADLCFKAPKLFTQSLVVPGRSSVLKRAFDRLVAAGIIEDCGKRRIGLAQVTHYSINRARYEEHDQTPRQSTTPRSHRSSPQGDGV